jgi:hypothetical protein
LCDPGPFRAWLSGASAAIIAAIALIIAAAVLNASFWAAGGSPIVMLAAAASAYIAVGLLSQAISRLNELCACLSESGGGSCSGSCQNLRTNLDAIRIVVGIQASACVAAAGIAWIPWAGAAPMAVILGALVVNAALLVSAMAFWVQLENCVSSESRVVRMFTMGITLAFSVAALSVRVADAGFSLPKR